MNIISYHFDSPPKEKAKYLIAYQCESFGKNEREIVYMTAEYTNEIYFGSVVEVDWYWILPQYCKQKNVLAWMPIPELTIYKEKGESDDEGD